MLKQHELRNSPIDCVRRTNRLMVAIEHKPRIKSLPITQNSVRPSKFPPGIRFLAPTSIINHESESQPLRWSRPIDQAYLRPWDELTRTITNQPNIFSAVDSIPESSIISGFPPPVLQHRMLQKFATAPQCNLSEVRHASGVSAGAFGGLPKRTLAQD